MSRLTNIDPMFILIFLLESSANYEQTNKRIVKMYTNKQRAHPILLHANSNNFIKNQYFPKPSIRTSYPYPT